MMKFCHRSSLQGLGAVLFTFSLSACVSSGGSSEADEAQSSVGSKQAASLQMEDLIFSVIDCPESANYVCQRIAGTIGDSTVNLFFDGGGLGSRRVYLSQNPIPEGADLHSLYALSERQLLGLRRALLKYYVNHPNDPIEDGYFAADQLRQQAFGSDAADLNFNTFVPDSFDTLEKTSVMTGHWMDKRFTNTPRYVYFDEIGPDASQQLFLDSDAPSSSLVERAHLPLNKREIKAFVNACLASPLVSNKNILDFCNRVRFQAVPGYVSDPLHIENLQIDLLDKDLDGVGHIMGVIEGRIAIFSIKADQVDYTTASDSLTVERSLGDSELAKLIAVLDQYRISPLPYSFAESTDTAIADVKTVLAHVAPALPAPPADVEARYPQYDKIFGDGVLTISLVVSEPNQAELQDVPNALHSIGFLPLDVHGLTDAQRAEYGENAQFLDTRRPFFIKTFDYQGHTVRGIVKILDATIVQHDELTAALQQSDLFVYTGSNYQEKDSPRNAIPFFIPQDLNAVHDIQLTRLYQLMMFLSSNGESSVANLFNMRKDSAAQQLNTFTTTKDVYKQAHMIGATVAFIDGVTRSNNVRQLQEVYKGYVGYDVQIDGFENNPLNAPSF